MAIENCVLRRFLTGCLALVLMLLATACTQTAGKQAVTVAPPFSDPALSDCCAKPERYPNGLVALAEPIAPLIGRTISYIDWRKGYLLHHSDALDSILTKLRPMDIVAISNKGRLSGHAIPGLFGHVAIYVGNERQLRAANLWDHPSIRKYRKQIQDGEIFIEADSKGVHLSTAELALNADAAVIMRPRGLSSKRYKQALTEFYDRIGMRFDYYFDLDTADCTFCTELVHRVLPEMRLPPHKVYGRNLILPDEVVAATIAHRTGLGFIGYVRSTRDAWELAGTKAAKADLQDGWRPADRTVASSAARATGAAVTGR